MVETSRVLAATRALERLMGLQLATLKFIAMFRVFHFSPRRSGVMTETTAPEWALHVDCPWRLDRDDAIMTGSRDWAIHEDGRLSPDEEDWSPQEGGSLQETVLRSVFEDPVREKAMVTNRTDGLVVENVSADTWGGFVITMSPNYRLSVFPDSRGRESWRIFRPGDLESHFVIPTPSPKKVDRQEG